MPEYIAFLRAINVGGHPKPAQVSTCERPRTLKSALEM
ncbi:MAG: DUF1697 domain-containing protein [candidate division Zixibacteria bacterium]|nr:DUF1697 domain-containing protein [candidate division Zixibacteria bacterium]